MLVTHPSPLAATGHGWLAPDQLAVSPNIRMLADRDRPEIEWHLLGLDFLSRRTRFGSAFADSAIIAWVDRIDLDRSLLLGSFEVDGHIVGLAEAHPGGMPRCVEIAVSVHRPYRRRRLGLRLVRRTIGAAFSTGAEVAEFLFARDNRVIIGFIRTLGGRFTGLERAEIRPGDLT